MQTQRLRHPIWLPIAKFWRRPTVQQWWVRMRDLTERALEKAAGGG